jgi:electron transport complex protein RnfC
MTRHIESLQPPDWGIDFPRPAATGTGLGIVRAPLPPVLSIALNQHIGSPAQPLVSPGDYVECGQPIAATTDAELGSVIHASTSGTVEGIDTLDLPGERTATAIRIASDGKDQRYAGYAAIANPLELTPTALRQAIIDAGIVGLGGAMFPAGIKLNPGCGIDTLILNGVECEPQMNCDDALMRQRPLDILRGAQVMLRILEADECLVAVKQTPQTGSPGPAQLSIQRALEELDDDRIRITPVPAVYPIGGEAQLIQILTGHEIPSGGLPWDTGIACQNVGTAAAITDLFASGMPLIERITTVTGGGVHQPVNVIARIGTPAAALIDCAGGYTADHARLIFGGPMMGVAARSDAVPVRKSTNCIYVAASSELGLNTHAMPCIRCGDCAAVCPATLTPQLLLQAQRANDLEQLEELGIMDCIECGCCDYVCPSHIALTPGFRESKHELWSARAAQRRADAAERRYAERNARLERAGNEQTERLQAQIDTLKDSDPAQALADLKSRLAARDTDREGSDP